MAQRCVRCGGCAAQSVEDRALPGVVQPDHHHLVLAAAKDAVVKIREAGSHSQRKRCAPSESCLLREKDSITGEQRRFLNTESTWSLMPKSTRASSGARETLHTCGDLGIEACVGIWERR